MCVWAQCGGRDGDDRRAAGGRRLAQPQHGERAATPTFARARAPMSAATVNVRTQEAIEVLALCKH